MALTIQVPLNTSLADLDEGVRRLLTRELTASGFDGVDLAFDTPSREWSSALTTPTVGLFLYDVREAAKLRQRTWTEHRADGVATLERPPLRLDCTYAVTAWAREIEDEHRLLSHVLAVLHAHERLPGDVLPAALQDPGQQPFPLHARVADPRGEGRADFWSAVGGQYKVSFDYVVTLACVPGVRASRGPEVRTRTVRVRDREPGSGAVHERHGAGGRVRDAAGAPVADAWVALPQAGRWASSDGEGRFRFTDVPAGTHRCMARLADGREGEAQLVVPGSGVDVVVAGRGGPGTGSGADAG